MSTLAADVTFDFTFPPCDPTTPPSFTFDPSLLEIPYNPGHARSSSHGSVYSFESSPSDSVAAPSTRRTTPARSPIRTHGPLLLPKIRSQDQAFTPSCLAAPAPKRARTIPAPVARKSSAFRPSHARSFTNPETIPYSAAVSFTDDSNNFLCSPVSFPQDSAGHSRRASTCSLDNVTLEKYGFPTYRQMPSYVPTARSSCSPTPPPQPQQLQAHLSQPDQFLFPQQYVPRAPSPLAAAATITPDLTPSTTLYSYLTSSNPAPSLVRTISFPLRDPHIKNFWWDVRQIRPWSNFNASAILAMPGASACLSMPVSTALLPSPMATQRHPETESALHSIYTSYYLPKLNNALALSSQRPLQLSVPSKSAVAAVSPNNSGMATDCMFVANVAGESASAAAIFGGKPTARVVGLVKSFDRFNTGMRVEGNVKRVEYLRGLAHLHHAMREHGCRYGFILTEIEMVFVRNGGDGTPHFGYLEVGSVQLAAAAPEGDTLDGAGVPTDAEQVQLTACLTLWGLCMLAGDEPMNGHAHWRADIGAPAEGTRRKALPRDDWMPQPQLAEKREAKRSRGWVWPEDAIGRKELGKRGVRYGAC
ncbi:hypothetical protein B0T26DRAFT_745461 [Lasiosphaeria miniovina]|uniref:Sialidase n=1 Tax=Lasiosphaeria miniovina TaxID=1954250 RepID=A0AA40BFT9_9PEZI|nr:uncharacterized protein B0T26DRAFT_745461 [Lasiosphaeria miniovina]KAK0733421.1 hypothetical protein B0T26DRAFT_745461 [Lasiosphaeria miniovina]